VATLTDSGLDTLSHNSIFKLVLSQVFGRAADSRGMGNGEWPIRHSTLSRVGL
jgi:hypothetical protein